MAKQKQRKAPAKSGAKPAGLKFPPQSAVRQPLPPVPPPPMPLQSTPLTMKLQASRQLSPNPTLMDLLGAQRG